MQQNTLSNDQKKPRHSGRPKDMGKQQAILQAASEIFLARGFIHTTMDEIATRANVSKITLYNHFTDKEHLFQAMIINRCNATSMIEDMQELAKLGAKGALTKVGEQFLALILSCDSMAMHRIVMPETQTYPQLGQLLYEAGPLRLKKALAKLLKTIAQQGALKINDPLVAASQFLSLCKGEIYLAIQLNLQTPDQSALRKHIQTTVTTFLKAYAPNKS